MVNRKSYLYVALAILTAAPRLSAGDGWYKSYDEALDAADETGIPLLIHFYAGYCGPCRQMKQQVFTQPDVQRQLRQGLAAVEVDVSKQPELASKYGASTVPRDVVVYPGRAPETVNIGFKSTLAYLELLRGISAKGIRFAAPDKPSPTKQKLASQKKIIGLEGFCPVKLIRDREWISGREDLTETYRGITYHFSSEKERAEFRQDSRNYTPQNLGCDPIVLYMDQRATIGKIKYGAFFDSQLYLFESSENRSRFKENPLKYTRIRHAIRIDELAGQRFN